MAFQNPAFIKGLYWTVGSCIAAQLIYAFNPETGWLHAVFFAANLILTDLFVFSYRKPLLECLVLLNYMVLTAGTASGMVSSPAVFSALLAPAGVYNIWLACRGIKVFSRKDRFDRVSRRNRAILEKNTGFMRIFFILVAMMTACGLCMGFIN